MEILHGRSRLDCYEPGVTAIRGINLNPMNSQPQHSHLRFHSHGDAVALSNPVIPKFRAPGTKNQSHEVTPTIDHTINERGVAVMNE